MIVDIIGTGQIGDSKRPNLQDGYSYESWVDLGNGTCRVFGLIEPKEIQEQRQESLKAASQMYVAEKILAGTLPKERLPDFTMTFDPPEKGRTYKKEWILRDPVTNELYEVVKETHTWLGIWKMSDIPSEFKPHRKEGEITPWKQPQGAHDAYKIGEKVSYNGSNWESTHNANVWAPGVFGWKKL